MPLTARASLATLLPKTNRLAALLSVAALLGAGGILPCGMAVAEQPIVHFRGDYLQQLNGQGLRSKGNRVYRGGYADVYQALDLDGDTVNDDSRIVLPFSLETELNPYQFDPARPGFEYRRDNHGAVFYGGVQAQYYNDLDYNGFMPNIHQAFIQYEGANYNDLREVNGSVRPFRADWPPLDEPDPYSGELWDAYSEITLFTYHASDHVSSELSTFQAAFLWKMEDFANVSATDQVSFDSDSVFQITTTRKWSNIGEARFVVQDGTDFFVSENWTAEGGASLVGVDVSKNALDLQWASWDPLSDPSDITFDAGAATFSTRSFGDVEAVGVYFAQNTPSNIETKLVFDEFLVTASVADSNGQPVARLVGDYNSDGEVDFKDFIRWEHELGSNVPEAGFGPDGNGDGAVNAADYDVWRDNLTAPLIAGDFNFDGYVDAADIDMLYANLGSDIPLYDLDLDGGAADQQDVDELVRNILQSEYGDTDLDFDVDLGDANTLAMSFTNAGVGGWADGDLTGDGLIDLSDANLMASTFGFTGGLSATAQSAAASVPEASSLILAIAAGLLTTGSIARSRTSAACLSRNRRPDNATR